MKRLIVVLMMLCPVAVMGQKKTSAKEYPLTVHVASSRIEVVPDDALRAAHFEEVRFIDLMRVTIEGRKYVLAGVATRGIFTIDHPVLIEPGDYPARVTLDKSPNPGEVRRTYELRLANGQTVQAFLWGIGW